MMENLTLNLQTCEDNNLTQVHSSKDESYADEALRLLVLFVLLGLITALLLAWQLIDRAPRWMVSWIFNLMRSRQSSNLGIISEGELSKVLRYKLDQKLSGEPSFKILFLGILTAVLIFFGALALFVAGEDSIHHAFWLSLAGSGLDWTFSEKSQERGWDALMVRCVSLLISVGGMLVMALLMSLVSDAIGSKVDELRKGKAAVLESDHVVIIGWSEKISILLESLALGKASSGGCPIVILAEKDKEEMEEAIASFDIDMHGSTVLCRNGDPLMRAEQVKVSAQFASAIVILASNTGVEENDARLIHIVLSLLGMHISLEKQGKGGFRGHIIAEVCDADNESLLDRLGFSSILHTVVSQTMAQCMLVQGARQPQMLDTLIELVGFEGNEFYVTPANSLVVGLPFAGLQSVFPMCVPVGLKSARGGKILLKPPPDRVVEAGDSLVMIAQDESFLMPDMAFGKAEWGLKYDTPKGSPKLASLQSQPPETGLDVGNRFFKASIETQSGIGQFCGRFLILGWCRDMAGLIWVLNHAITGPSELWLYSTVALDKREWLLLRGSLEFDKDGYCPDMPLLRVRFRDPILLGSIVNKWEIESLDVLQFKSVLIISDESHIYRGEGECGEAKSNCMADSMSLNSLLLLRETQINQLRERRKAIQDKTYEAHTLAAETPRVTPLGLGPDSSAQSPGVNELSAWGAQSGVFERDGLSFTRSVKPSFLDNVMPSLLYESKASFLQRLTDFYGVSTVTNQITSQPCHVAQLSPLQEIQEFQAFTSPYFSPDCSDGRKSRAISSAGGSIIGMPIDPHGWDRALRSADSSFLIESEQQPSPMGSEIALEKDQNTPEEASPFVASGMVSASLTAAALDVSNCHRVDPQQSEVPQSQHDMEKDLFKYWVEDMRDVVSHTTVVTQAMDRRTPELVHEVAKLPISKFILSNDAAATLLALVSCCPERHDIYQELLWPEGNQIVVRVPATILNQETEAISFLEASTRAIAMNEVLIGYVERGTRKTVLNPPDKKAIVMSHASVHALLTIAGPNHIRKRG